MSILMLKRFSVGVPPVSISTAYTPTGGYGIRPYGLPIPLHSACRQLRRGGGTPPYVLPKKGNVGRPALWPPCPLAPSYAIRAAAPHSPGTPRGTAPWRKASLVKGRCRACEAEGFLPACGVHLLPFWRYAPPPPARGSLSLTREAFLPNLKLHFKFHSCKIWQSVLQSHSIPF